MLGLRVRCDGCGAMWAAHLPLADLACDEQLAWSRCEADAEPGAGAIRRI